MNKANENYTTKTYTFSDFTLAHLLYHAIMEKQNPSYCAYSSHDTTKLIVDASVSMEQAFQDATQMLEEALEKYHVEYLQ